MSKPLIDIRLEAPVEDVWRHLREFALVRRWFGWDYDGLDAEIEAIFGEHAAADAGTRSIEWTYGPGHSDAFALEADGSATVLRATRESPEPGGAYDAIAEGWITFLQQLRFVLARTPGEERRTRHWSSPVHDPGALPVARVLGLGAALDVPPGGSYAATGEAGVPGSGTVWFHSAHQVGVTVDALGDALLIVWEKPSAAGPPHGEASATLSAYGAATERLDEQAERWQAWWSRGLGAPE